MTDRDHDEEPESGGGEMRPEDVDRRFNELIRDLDPQPADTPTEPMKPPPPKDDEDEPTLLELWDAELPEDEDEEDYVPPEPEPMPWPSLPAIGGVLFIIGGLLLLVRPDIAPLGQTPGRLVGFGVFALGVWLLFTRLRPDHSEDDGDGAVV